MKILDETHYKAGKLETQYMTFSKDMVFAGEHWLVLNKKSRDRLGSIEFYSGWHQFVFVPCDGTEFNNTCLTTIADVLADLTAYRKAKQ